MSQINLDKIKLLIAPATIFGADVTTNEFKLDNYQSAKIYIVSGAGDETTTTAHVIINTLEDTEQEIITKTINIGGNQDNVIDLIAEQCAHYNVDTIKVKIDGIASNETIGCVCLVLSEPRFGYDDVTIAPVVVESETTEETSGETDNTDNIDNAGGTDNTETENQGGTGN